jgi:2-succinyl-5-enolpyruvyl-6-hydroxy-3-cyclohexene-1-carboxylate synthase
MKKKYTSEKNIQYLIAFLKEYKISKIVASPGTTNLSFVASMQSDPYFEMYSCVDERSAAYMAVGLAEESGEPIVITCTGATASRNYVPALTEAYYRKLPILVVTGTKNENWIGHLNNQLIDRRNAQNDVIVHREYIPSIKDEEDEFFCQLHLNIAFNALKRKGGGPVHLNLQTQYSRDFSVEELPCVRRITRLSYCDLDNMPIIPIGRIGIFVGSHCTFNKELTESVDNFCSCYDAVVFCDHTSGYYGKYRFNYGLVGSQKYSFHSDIANLDLCIHIGEVSAEYAAISNLQKKEVWRVNEDGEIRDTFRKLTYLFEMSEQDFFDYYVSEKQSEQNGEYLKKCKETYNNIYEKIPELPFSNVWIAQQLHNKLPVGSSLHLGILNSLRSWNLFNLPEGVTSFGNVGGFGIDGCMSSMIGASLANPNKLFFGIFGDLSFFYDMNSAGNRHISNNIRILLINNGRGQEFRNFYHTGSLFGDDADQYIAAGGHFGDQSPLLVKHYAEDLGYEYMSATTKEEFLSHSSRFISGEKYEKPIIFEVFTDTKDESDALLSTWSIEKSSGDFMIGKAIDALGGKKAVINIIGKKNIAFFKKLLKR